MATLLVMPIAMIYPEHFHVDANTILQDGKIFGGDGAVIPQVRESLIKATGIGGTVGDILRDPIPAILNPICGLFGC